MKALLLLRHADSGEKLHGQADKERALTSKGIRQSVLVANFMKEKEWKPDKVIASDALRVRSTVDLILNELKTPLKVKYLEELYEAEIQTYLDTIRQVSECQTLLVAGHNPAISAFASFISVTKVGGVGTANLLVFHFKEDSWSKLKKADCELMEHFMP